MSARVSCPSCGAVSRDAVSTDEHWGIIVDDCELESAMFVHGDDDVQGHLLSYDLYELDDVGRRTHECRCGKTVWVGDRGDPHGPGRWFVEATDRRARQVPDEAARCSTCDGKRIVSYPEGDGVRVTACPACTARRIDVVPVPKIGEPS